MPQIILTSGERAVVSEEDYEWARQWSWYVTAKKSGSTGYAGATVKGQKVYLHRMIGERMGICSPGDGGLIDHMNRDRFDCRRENLRRANWSMNSANRTQASATGHLGVEEYRPGRFRAVIERDGVRTRKHGFTSAEAAAAWRDEYRVATFGY